MCVYIDIDHSQTTENKLQKTNNEPRAATTQQRRPAPPSSKCDWQPLSHEEATNAPAYPTMPNRIPLRA